MVSTHLEHESMGSTIVPHVGVRNNRNIMQPTNQPSNINDILDIHTSNEIYDEILYCCIFDIRHMHELPLCLSLALSLSLSLCLSVLPNYSSSLIKMIILQIVLQLPKPANTLFCSAQHEEITANIANCKLLQLSCIILAETDHWTIEPWLSHANLFKLPRMTKKRWMLGGQAWLIDCSARCMWLCRPTYRQHPTSRPEPLYTDMVLEENSNPNCFWFIVWGHDIPKRRMIVWAVPTHYTPAVDSSRMSGDICMWSETPWFADADLASETRCTQYITPIPASSNMRFKSTINKL